MRKVWLLVIPGLAVAVAVAYFGYQEYERQRLFVNCYSDKLYPIAALLKQFSRDHGRFPDQTTFFSSRSEKSRDWLGKCTGSNQPFVWNPRITEVSAGSTGRVPLVWCPPGSHGKYVGVVALAGGDVKAEIITANELNDLLAAR